MKIITAGHMNMEKKVLNPHSGVGCLVILFYINGLEALRELMLHDLISEAMRVCGASISGRVAT